MPNNQCQRRTCYALCLILYPVSAAHLSIFWQDDDFKGGGLGALAWGVKDLMPEPIPVRVDDGYTREYPPPDL